MIKLTDYITDPVKELADLQPWMATSQANKIVSSMMGQLSSDFVISNGNAIHRTAIIEKGVTLKSPCIIGANCFVAANAYLRGGVWLDESVIIGPSCEIKSSFIFSGSKAAHFNFIGDSIVGRDVNIEAGAIVANYRNEFDNKEIICIINADRTNTGVQKFGSLIGDQSKIGANAVLVPGTILQPNTIVHRLSLVDQTI